MRVVASGTITYILQARVNGKQMRRSIGKFRVWPLQKARDEANRLRRLIDQGQDPWIKVAPKSKMPPVTIAKLGDLYMRHTANRQADRYVKQLTLAYGDKLPGELRRRDIIALVEKKAKTAPQGARMLLSYTKAFLSWAAEREYVEHNVASVIKPARVDPTMKARRRDRVLTDAEIIAVWRAPLTPATAVLRLILATGQRPGECREVSAQEIVGDEWHIPAHRRKGKVDHDLPMTDFALAVARDVLRLGVAPKHHVTKAAQAIQVEPNAKGHWTPHDLRRTARTTLARLGISDEVGERVLSHSAGGLVATYNRYAFMAEMRDALQTYHDWLSRLSSAE